MFIRMTVALSMLGESSHFRWHQWHGVTWNLVNSRSRIPGHSICISTDARRVPFTYSIDPAWGRSRGHGARSLSHDDNPYTLYIICILLYCIWITFLCNKYMCLNPASSWVYPLFISYHKLIYKPTNQLLNLS